ncbi:hypothetical protein CDCA_CDCA19G4694 [Cyanidium caldarium]|uniref:Uncharacterized protein n=1 Tax=Cyanidium caldarium TaxID=2771 RepID=A0AAV9J2W2_CYACA|nr:hypothetical protein CDCA_CDCA19G4694 [Cyanidium caldarium]
MGVATMRRHVRARHCGDRHAEPTPRSAECTLSQRRSVDPRRPPMIGQTGGTAGRTRTRCSPTRGYSPASVHAQEESVWKKDGGGADILYDTY